MRRPALEILAVGLALAGCGRGVPYLTSGATAGGGSPGGGTSGAATSAGSTGSGTTAGSTSGTGTGSSSTGGSSSLSTAGAFTPNTQVTAELAIMPGYPRSGLVVLLGDFVPPVTCSELYDNDAGAVGQLVALELYQPDLTIPLGVGSYNVIPAIAFPLTHDGGVAVVLVGSGLEDGGFAFAATGLSGEVSLTQLDVGTAAAGSFTAALVSSVDGSSVGTLTGTFDAPWCGPVD